MSAALSLFGIFFCVGAFTFGGGYAMLPLIESMVVGRGYLAAEELYRFIAVAECTPGPLAINVATFVGMNVGGLGCAVMATLGVVLPSFIIILLVARVYRKFRESRIVEGVMKGLRPAVVGLLACALGNLIKSLIGSLGGAGWRLLPSAALLAVDLYLTFNKKWNPIWVLLLSAAAGALIFGIF